MPVDLLAALPKTMPNARGDLGAIGRRLSALVYHFRAPRTPVPPTTPPAPERTPIPALPRFTVASPIVTGAPGAWVAAGPDGPIPFDPDEPASLHAAARSLLDP